ncbi:sulfurtransferase TusA family protein [Leucothrix arctica]|uniref:Preprotein translocase subunit TatC n=1 Tax=Leucothrix arctica TaxID=1481894 RepID=A0A317CFQ6_9GAMM|nr:sulfurtransferase TusA family protein [Leucothrix arctica]PWQ97346.1 preprotein translocase subunit TatC [Leucothrix arctica]
MSEFNQEVDATGLNCPLPILRCKKAMNGLESGNVLKITATDGGSPKDFEAYCKQTGDELLSSIEENNKFIFMIKKK